MMEWTPSIDVVTVFVEDLAQTRAFYEVVFGATPVFQNQDSAVFKFGSLAVNLLEASSAPELIEPAKVGSPNAGARFQFTIMVDDVHAVCDLLASRGVSLLNGPMDRWWGMRTASFVDPAGYIWEVAQDLEAPAGG